MVPLFANIFAKSHPITVRVGASGPLRFHGNTASGQGARARIALAASLRTRFECQSPVHSAQPSMSDLLMHSHLGIYILFIC